MLYENALHAVWQGKAVLFVGSGFSSGAQSLNEKNFPTGTELAKLLCKEAELKETTDLRQASSRYIKKLNEDSIIELLTNIYSARHTTSAQKIVASAPWKGIYTTNYDNILERGASDLGKKLRPVELSSNPRHYKDNTNCVLHINGFIDTLNPETLTKSFKLTSASYLTEKFRESAWSTIFTRQIMSAHAVFFVGYSLYDLEIQEILFAEKSLREKTFFIEYPGLDDEDVEFSDLNDFGTLLPIGVEKFSDDLNASKLTKIDVNTELTLPGFREQLAPGPELSINHRDSDIFKLLLQGIVDESFLWGKNSSLEKNEYLFPRETYEDEEKHKRKYNYIITSDLGNGKTIFCHKLAQNFIKSGHRVFWLLDESYDSYDEIESICALNIPCLVIIENYARKMNLIEHVKLKRNDKLILAITERSSVHENNQEELYYARKIVDLTESIEIDLNKLSELDINSLAKYLEKYGLWGERSALSHAKKIEYIKKTCDNELHGVLLGVLKSNQIQKKFSALFPVFSGDILFTKTIISAFVLKMLGITDPAPHTISALANTSIIFDPRFKKNEMVRQLFNNVQGGLSPKSSALAEFSLQSFNDVPLLVTTLIQIANSARKKAFGSEMYWKLYREIASFKNIQRMLPEKGKRENLIEFYEGLKEVDVERENPHFWLQYAIARLTFPDLDNLNKVKIYLDTALGLAKKKVHYTTTDIETQYARYHLEYADNADLTADGAFNEFHIAHDKLLKITAIERHKREPFRPIRLYEKIFKKYADKFTIEQIQFINDAAVEMLGHIKFLPYGISREPTVLAAADSLKSVKNLSYQHLNSRQRGISK